MIKAVLLVCLLLIWVIFAMQDKPWQQDASHALFEIIPPPCATSSSPHPEISRDLSGSQFVLDIKTKKNIWLGSRGSSPDRKQPSLNLTFFTYRMGIRASAFITS